MAGPLAFGPLQTLATSGYGTFYQIPGRRRERRRPARRDPRLHLPEPQPDMGSAPPTICFWAPRWGRPPTPSPWWRRGSWRPDAVDFSKASFVRAISTGTAKPTWRSSIWRQRRPDHHVARSNGDGTFTLGPAQTFAGVPGIASIRSRATSTATARMTWPSQRCAVFRPAAATAGDNNHVYLATSGRRRRLHDGRRPAARPGHRVARITTPTPAISTATARPTWCSTPRARRSNSSILPARQAMPTACTRRSRTGREVSALSGRQAYGASGWADYPMPG